MGFRCVLARPKHDIVSDGVSMRADVAGGLFGGLIWLVLHRSRHVTFRASDGRVTVTSPFSCFNANRHGRNPAGAG